MFRYIGLIWNKDSSAQQDASLLVVNRLMELGRGWQIVFQNRGICVLAADLGSGASECHALRDNCGVVLGTLFEGFKELSAPVLPRKASLDDAATRKIVASRGGELIASYWGRYVAFIVDPSTDLKWVLKDPTGHLPCFRTQFRGVQLYFSALSDCLALNLLSFTVNWNFLPARLAFGLGQIDATALNEVQEVYSGQRMEIGGSESTSSICWDPFAIATDPLEDPDAAACALRSVTKSCTHAWASRYNHVLHELSGGLDSSIVLGCLGDAPSHPELTCLTYFLPKSQSDERHYARLAASSTNCRHVEHARNPTAIRLQNLLRLTPLVNPLSTDYSCLEVNDSIQDLTDRYHIDGICSGDGGDSLFGAYSYRDSASDYVRRHGMDPRFLRVAAQLAPHMKLSFWALVVNAIRNGIKRDVDFLGEDNGVSGRKFLQRDILQAYATRKSCPHPWYQGMAGATSGTTWLVVATALDRDFYDPMSRPDAPAPEPFTPLRSQPLIELSLRIPSYVHGEHGRKRGLARRAFKPDVPEQILRRYWKDRGVGMIDGMFAANFQFIREMLLDGVLVKRGLVDGPRLAAALSGSPTKDAAWLEIIDYVLVETWLDPWLRNRKQVAA